jgi:hypothetical protein
MRPILQPILYLIAGFAFAALLQLLTFCNRDDDFLKNSINADELKANIDEKAMKAAIDEYKSAFNIADRQTISELTFEDSYQMNSESLSSYTDDELTEIGNAMRKARLNMATENFAEYTYIIGKHEFTFAMGLDEDGIWKLIRY